MAAEIAHDTEHSLRHECGVFTRYLTSREPDDYLLGKYVAMQDCAVRGDATPSRIDAALLGMARLGVAGTRIADAYARILRPQTRLRRKLILVLAIAENSRGFHRGLTSGAAGSRPASAIRVAFALAAFTLALFVGLLIFTPVRLLPNARGGRGSQ